MAAPDAVEQLEPEAVTALEFGLVALLQNVVGAGASIGFLRPLAADEAARYWQSVGSIPEYARSASGALDANAIYYRLLDK